MSEKKKLLLFIYISVLEMKRSDYTTCFVDTNRSYKTYPTVVFKFSCFISTQPLVTYKTLSVLINICVWVYSKRESTGDCLFFRLETYQQYPKFVYFWHWIEKLIELGQKCYPLRNWFCDNKNEHYLLVMSTKNQ